MQDPVDQPLRLGTHMVAGYWRYLMPEELPQLKFPAESRSACLSCPKVASDRYRSDYRCCTYFPRVSNFALGLILGENQEGAEIVRELIKDGFILPEGMIPTPQKWAQYFVETEEDRYGKTDKVLCPFLNKDNGFCRIYAYRNSVCSTFFCLKDAGEKGEQFWEELQSLGSQCELALSQWVMNEAGVNPEKYYQKLDRMEPARAGLKQSKAWSAGARESLWGPWFGREEEFLKKTAAVFRENRERLWSLANSLNIREALAFERKSLECVPAKHRPGARKDLNLEEGDQVPAWKIWNTVLNKHTKMWTVPGGLIRLSDRVRFEGVSPETAGSLVSCKPGRTVTAFNSRNFAARAPFGAREGDPGVAGSWVISEAEFRALKLFGVPAQPDFELLKKIEKIAGVDPAGFVSNWFHKKVLVSYKVSAPESILQ